MRWHIVTGEYPPDPGGVGDYTRQVACGLAAGGDEIDVWTHPTHAIGPLLQHQDEGVHVHRLPGGFGIRGLAAMSRELDRFPPPRHIFVQYVPHAYGYKAMNLAFCWWLRSRRKDAVWIMFHEVRFPMRWNQPPAHNVIAVMNLSMARIAARAANRIFIATEFWRKMVAPIARIGTPIQWLPVPSNIPVSWDRVRSAEIHARYAGAGRFLVGHFGTFGSHTKDLLLSLLPRLIAAMPRATFLLLGRNNEAFRLLLAGTYPEAAARAHAPDSLSGPELSCHIAACDVMVQPFPDGVTSRRTSLMAGLALERPVVTTSGERTEDFWRETRAVALADLDDPAGFVDKTKELLENEVERKRLAAAAGALYRSSFDLTHTIAALRQP
ncbi:MAG: glycosyltransferase [Acidobacteriota bacterium]|nr:glycosyltransferase [Acidobacteriota bacterium]